MKSIYIHHHLGLGDCIDCNAIARIYAKEYDKVNIFCKECYSYMVTYMYRDNPKINVITIPDGIDENYFVKHYLDGTTCTMEQLKGLQPMDTFEGQVEFLKIGHDNYPWGQEEKLGKGCAEIFYDLVNIPYIKRFEEFYYERDPKEEKRVYDKLNPNDEEYIFVHDDASRGYPIDDDRVFEYNDGKEIKIIRNDMSENLFFYGMILEKAKQIHCMESSFRSIVEILDTTDELYFHSFRTEAYVGNSTRREWKEVPYTEWSAMK